MQEYRVDHRYHIERSVSDSILYQKHNIYFEKLSDGSLLATGSDCKVTSKHDNAMTNMWSVNGIKRKQYEQE